VGLWGGWGPGGHRWLTSPSLNWKFDADDASSERWIINSAKVLSLSPKWLSSSVHTCGRGPFAVDGPSLTARMGGAPRRRGGGSGGGGGGAGGGGAGMGSARHNRGHRAYLAHELQVDKLVHRQPRGPRQRPRRRVASRGPDDVRYFILLPKIEEGPNNLHLICNPCCNLYLFVCVWQCQWLARST